MAEDISNRTRTASRGQPPIGAGPFAMVLEDGAMETLVPDTALLALGFTPFRAPTVSQARAFCAAPDLDLVIMPLTLDGQSLLPIVRECSARPNAPALVVIARNDEINDAAEAMRSGADDCLFNPYSEARLRRTLIGALDHSGRSRPALPADTGPEPAEHVVPLAPPPTLRRPDASPDPAHLPDPLPQEASQKPAPRFHGLIGGSPAMQAVFNQVRTVAPSDAPIILLGETGTGKTSLAQAIHQASDRATGPFTILKCAGLTDTALTRMLTPDGPQDQALFTRTAGGTLLINRLDELSRAAQAQLFSALHEVEQTPEDQRPRILATLSDHPTALLASGSLRPDLYYALKVVELTLPPLRHRAEDLPALIDMHLTDMATRDTRAQPVLTTAARRALTQYDWPGNLRELANVLRGLVLTRSGERIDRDDLPPAIVAERAVARLALQYGDDGSQGDLSKAISPLIGKRLADIERAVIEATIAREDGSIPRAARVLDLSPSTIYRKRDTWDND